MTVLRAIYESQEPEIEIITIIIVKILHGTALRNCAKHRGHFSFFPDFLELVRCGVHGIMIIRRILPCV